jgi:hypothetical protein
VRLLGSALLRAGYLITAGALLGGLLLAAYLGTEAVHRLAYGEYPGEKDAVEHLLLFPLGAAIAGTIVAILGLILTLLGQNALGLPRRSAQS